MPSATGLSAEPSGVHIPLLGEGRRVTRVVVERVPHALRHRIIDVVADQVHQLEGPHAEAAEFRHCPVNRGDVRNALLVNPDGLAIEGPRHAVHNESRRVLRDGRLLAPVPHQDRHLLGQTLPGLQGGDHLHKGQEGSRVEKVQAQEAGGVGQSSRQPGDGQARGVRGQDGGLPHNGFQRGEDGLLDVFLLHDGLNDQTAGGTRRQLGRRPDSGQDLIGFTGGQPPFLDEPLEDPVQIGQCPRDGGLIPVHKEDIMASRSGNLGNALTHRSGADDAHSHALFHQSQRKGPRQ